MSIYSALTNPNTIIRITGTSAATTGSKTYVYLTLTGCPTQFTTQRAIITASGAGITACGLSIYEGIATSTEIANPVFTNFTLDSNTYSAVLNISSRVLNPYNNGMIQASIHSQSGNIPAGLVFTLTLEGTADNISDTDYSDNGTYAKDDSLKVLRWDNTAGATVDLTNLVRQMMIVDNTPSQIPISLNTSSDFLYIGSENKATLYEFIIDNASRQSASGVCNWTTWNGSSWTAATVVLDSTTSNQNTGTGLEYSGIIQFNTTAATPTQLTAAVAATLLGAQTGDPTYNMIAAITAGTAPPVAFTYCPARYWLRLNIASNGVFPIRIYGIHPLNSY